MIRRKIGQSIETELELTPMLELADKHIKTIFKLYFVFKKVNRNM